MPRRSSLSWRRRRDNDWEDDESSESGGSDFGEPSTDSEDETKEHDEEKSDEEDEEDVERLLAITRRSLSKSSGQGGWIDAQRVLNGDIDALDMSTHELKDAVDEKCRTALHLALLSNNLKMVSCIMDRTIRKPIERAKREGKMRLRAQEFETERMCMFCDHTGCKRRAEENRRRLEREIGMTNERLLIQALTKTDRNGWTALHYAAQGRPGAMRLLLEYAPDSTVFGGVRAFDAKTGAKTRDQSKPWATARKNILETRADVASTQDSTGSTPLHIAAANGNVEAINSLLRWGADRYVCDIDGNTPSDVAIDRATRKTLGNGGVGMLAKDICNDKFSTSSRTRNPRKSLECLIQCGENINERSGLKLQSALHHACDAGDADLVLYLIQSTSVDIELVDAAGWTALHYCAKKGNHRVADILLQHGANVNAVSLYSSVTPLHLAVGQDRNRIMTSLLIRSGAKLDAKDGDGYTPLLVAAKRGCCVTAFELVESGCNIYATERKGQNSLHLACFHGHMDFVKMLTFLDGDQCILKTTRSLQGKFPSDLCRDPKLRQALNSIWECASKGALDGVRRIVQEHRRPNYGAVVEPWTNGKERSLNQKSYRRGLTPLHAAVLGGACFPKEAQGKATVKRKYSEEQTATFLLSQAEVFVDVSDFQGCTPLMYACKLGNSSLVELLIAKGASVDLTDNGGNTALHYAHAFIRGRIVNKLTSIAGDTTEVKNHKNQTPLMVSGLKTRLYVPPLHSKRKNRPKLPEKEDQEEDNHSNSNDDEESKREEDEKPDPKTLQDVAREEEASNAKVRQKPSRGKDSKKKTLQQIADEDHESEQQNHETEKALAKIAKELY